MEKPSHWDRENADLLVIFGFVCTGTLKKLCFTHHPPTPYDSLTFREVPSWALHWVSEICRLWRKKGGEKKTLILIWKPTSFWFCEFFLNLSTARWLSDSIMWLIVSPSLCSSRPTFHMWYISPSYRPKTRGSIGLLDSLPSWEIDTQEELKTHNQGLAREQQFFGPEPPPPVTHHHIWESSSYFGWARS